MKTDSGKQRIVPIHTRTRAKKADVDEYALKEMAGHKILDITESVYTLRDLEWLRSDIEKIG